MLDEADSLTKDAQTALRRIMEQYTYNTRFCLTSNFLSRIIDPLASRCIKYRFSKMQNTSIIKHLMKTYLVEYPHVENKNLEKICREIAESVHGDFREAIIVLQGLSLLDSNLKNVQVDRFIPVISN